MTAAPEPLDRAMILKARDLLADIRWTRDDDRRNVSELITAVDALLQARPASSDQRKDIIEAAFASDRWTHVDVAIAETERRLFRELCLPLDAKEGEDDGTDHSSR